MPRRFRFSVLEAASLRANGTYHTKPLTNAICKNCKQSDTLVQRTMVDPPHIYFCTNCGLLTPTRAIRHKRGLMAPTIQQTAELGQTGLAQPTLASASASGGATGNEKNNTRTARGIHTQTVTNPLLDTLTKKGYQIID